jgi:hypothetical protein
VLEELLTREGLAGVAHQEPQQVELADGQREPAAGQRRGVLDRVDDQVAVGDRTFELAGPTRLSRSGIKAKDQLAWAETPAAVAFVGAMLEPDDTVGLGVQGGHVDDPSVVVSRAQPETDLEPVDPGQHEIEDERVCTPVLYLCQSHLSVRSLAGTALGRTQVGHDVPAHRYASRSTLSRTTQEI